MRDGDVRPLVREQLRRNCRGDRNTIIVEELGLCCGSVRVDIAVVNGNLQGYEIKSAQDTLTRLPVQASVYNRIFDTMTVVVAERHLRAAGAMIPGWWGIQVVTAPGSSESLKIEQIRAESTNTRVDPYSLIQLLWRDELLRLLHQRTPLKSLRSKPRRVLWEALSNYVPLPELKDFVCTCLKTRPHWRVDAQRRQDGGKYQPCARLSDSHY